MKTSELDKFIDINSDKIRSLYGTWDKGDCSIIGLLRILMIQEIEKEINDRGQYYDGQYDEILLSLHKNYYT